MEATVPQLQYLDRVKMYGLFRPLFLHLRLFVYTVYSIVTTQFFADVYVRTTDIYQPRVGTSHYIICATITVLGRSIKDISDK